MYDPAGKNSEHSKWIEIYNLGKDFVFQTKKSGDLYKLLDFYTCDGYRKKKNDTDKDKCIEHSITTDSEAEIVLNSKEYLIIADSTEKFKTDYLINQKVLKSSINLTLSKTAFIKLCFQDDDHCSIVKYGEFFKEKGGGYSLEKIEFSRDYSQENWRESYILGGTPGYENFTGEDKKTEPKTYSKEIRINELLPNPQESPESKYEYVELYNPGGESIDLSGWTLKDKTGEYKLSGNIWPETYLVFYDTISLNNGGDEITLYNPNGEIVSQVSYDHSEENVSYNFNGTNWRWSKYITPGAENEFNELTGTKIKADRKIYKNTYADFKAKIKNPDNDKLKFTWDFGDGHKSYKKNTRHKYDKTGKFTVTLKVFDGSEETTEEFKIEVKNFPKNKIKITEISPNPEGRDSEGEYIVVKNESKKKINLKNWAIASGSKKLYNHPISKDLVIKPGETVKIGRDISKFALNNKKAKVELRYPDGKVAYKMKYKKNGSAVAEGELYAKVDKKWQWIAAKPVSFPTSAVAIATLPQETNIIASATMPTSFAIKISAAEIQKNLGKISEDKNKKENRLILASYNSKFNLPEPQGRVLGVSTVRENENYYTFTSPTATEKHWVMKFWESIYTTANSFINKLLLQF